VILDDASAQHPFAADAYVRERHAHSVLCLPLLKQAELIGVLYLENNLASHVFTPSRLTVLKLLASQAAVALENARLAAERQAHLWFLESLERVNRAMQGTNDLEQMMGDVLDAVLSIFHCDRAWLTYPCEPDPAWWRVVMERTRAEFPGASAWGRAAPCADTVAPQDLPMEPRFTEVFRAVRAVDGPLQWGPGGQPVPGPTAERFRVQSMLAMALYPKGDRPYTFGLHQCTSPRLWTPQEERLFQEIGRRLADALTGLLMFRSLRESERRLDEAQRIAHVGYWDRDLDTGRITLSDEACRIFGLQPEERVVDLTQWHERWLVLIHTEDQPRIAEAAAAALRGGPPYDVEYRVVRPGGEVRMIYSRGEVTWDESGRPRRMFGMMQDITERKRAEQRLVAQHSVTRILAEVATVEDATPQILQALCECLGWDLGTLWRIDQEAGVLRCAQMWRKPSVEATQFEAATRASTFRPGRGLPGQVWASRAPACIPDVVHDPGFLRARFAAREGLHAAFAFPILLGSEVLGVIDVVSREIRQPDQDLLDMMASVGSQIGQFIERKRAEESLRQAQAELAHVARLTTLGELTASIAHEINQPLGAMVNSANACVRWLAAQNLERAQQSALRIVADGQRAGAIITRIRALAKNAPSYTDWLDINDTIRDVLALARSEVHRHRVVVETHPAEPVPLVLADHIQLQQVLLNLVINAIEAMSGVDDGPRQLAVQSDPDAALGVRVTVRDSGPGLDPQRLDQLFDAFYTTKPHGLGLGLAISRRIVEAHGGRLWASANVPHGAVFQFTVPRGSEEGA
jgi:PAS domain S-box-containing protein